MDFRLFCEKTPVWRSFLSTFLCFLMLCASHFVGASEPVDIAQRAEQLKKELIELNRELYQFEEELLHPANTQLALFLAIDPDSNFVLDSIELRLNDEIVTTHLYQEKELAALKKGGIQRLYLGSLVDGQHKLSARFNGQGSNSRYYRRKKALNFTKGDSAKYIQLIITENGRTREPLFKVKQW